MTQSTIAIPNQRTKIPGDLAAVIAHLGGPTQDAVSLTRVQDRLFVWWWEVSPADGAFRKKALTAISFAVTALVKRGLIARVGTRVHLTEHGLRLLKLFSSNYRVFDSLPEEMPESVRDTLRSEFERYRRAIDS